ncbi:putative S-adenosyl-L-methionine-dependent methyltransferase protein [Corchorus capsularis]|uniref:Putative S-adenosyl-L-methionine-dependent methyltransferase protein n=1 Tax=Corchorus capsularis TaxID=210143 RepID=A0A1R3J1N0_COCAP|nr:putative S-adenosyl-L-methionine-dependent methyltransferase protein [Corchorus capsularis]
MKDSTISDLLQELNTTKAQLIASYSLIAELQKTINSTNLLTEALLVELSREQRVNAAEKVRELLAKDDDYFGVAASSSDELKLSVLPQKLPLGYSPRSGSEAIYPPVGAGCLKFQDELAQYMTYEVGGECPVDDVFAQKLILRGCEPLPRRRCHPKSPVGYVEPRPFPASLWATPPDTSIVWDPYTCKSYKCLIERNKLPGIYDCKDCFDLNGREKKRWLFDGGLDYGIDQVLGTKPPGTIRIGFDIGGGSGTFAARMRERNITIITSSMNLDGPFNSFIASRGLIPMHISISQRLPFFENTLDIVHSMHVLSNWIPDDMLEFTLYDIYRVLRPGGLFWLDRFFCQGSQLNQTYIPLFDRIGFKKLRWNSGKKVDRGADKNEWYFSALLEKPMT